MATIWVLVNYAVIMIMIIIAGHIISDCVDRVLKVYYRRKFIYEYRLHQKNK